MATSENRALKTKAIAKISKFYNSSYSRVKYVQIMFNINENTNKITAKNYVAKTLFARCSKAVKGLTKDVAPESLKYSKTGLKRTLLTDKKGLNGKR